MNLPSKSPRKQQGKKSIEEQAEAQVHAAIRLKVETGAITRKLKRRRGWMVGGPEMVA